jgi:hypothetical protein
MNWAHILGTYFQGEKVEALVFILPIGLLSLVFGTWLLTEGGAFARGVATPFVVMGIVMATVGGVVGYRTPAQMSSLKSGFSHQTETTRLAEIARMKKVNDAWPVYLAIWATFGISGLALRFFTQGEFTRGLGISLVFFAGVTLLIDGFAERRAQIYAQELNAEREKFE